MGYFKAVSLIMGSLTLASAAWFYFFRAHYAAVLLGKLMPPARPGWMPQVFAAVLVWTAVTWFFFMKSPGTYSLLISLYISLGVIKSILLLRHYERMRALVKALLETEKAAMHLVMLSALAVGCGLIWLGFSLD